MLVTPGERLKERTTLAHSRDHFVNAHFPLYKSKAKHSRLKPAALSVTTWWPMTGSSKDILGSGPGEKRKVLP